MSMGFDSSTWRITGETLSYLFNQEWLNVWKLKVLENRGDIAVDFKGDKGGTINVTTRDCPQKKGWTRLLPTNDVLLAELENGTTVTLEMTPPVYTMIQNLLKRGLGEPYGIDCSQEFINRVEGTKK